MRSLVTLERLLFYYGRHNEYRYYGIIFVACVKPFAMMSSTAHIPTTGANATYYNPDYNMPQKGLECSLQEPSS